MRRVVTSAPSSFVRLFLGRRAADDLGVGRAPFLHYLGHQLAFVLAGRSRGPVQRAGEGLRSVPTQWARTPAQLVRRRAVLRFGERIDGWRKLPPPSFGA
jgi:hypothetical protein